ncbi:tyrosine-type recombinase/integrase [Burkholderia sp. BE17]|uniref:tyrosine-type recombinase/integrase n=1 Tax=Burkholderia sp. BE17 TaxID=2656644 RepID=UPI00128AEC73|nr:site-specific integrase [Burkholderia sp. BE17]MPV67680.1 DUF4102 domain-containing protein [Burkholderia sp. BE17]
MALTDKQAKALKPGDKPVFDGKVPGLFLSPTTSGGKWTLRYTSPVTGKRRDAGLGTYPEVSIADARDKAVTMRRVVDAGNDPIDERKRKRQAENIAAAALTFEKAAHTLHAELKPGWKNEKDATRWIATLKTYTFPKLGAKRLDSITPADCADVLRPIWLDKSPTANRMRQQMHAIFQWAWAHGHVAANPVSVVDHILPKQTARKRHQPAMPWRDVPAFVKAHVVGDGRNDISRAALYFTILTAARSGEVRGATWDECDLETGVWTIPSERMKGREPHRVPLSGPALTFIKALKEHQRHNNLIFPSPRGKVLCDMSITELLRHVKAKSDSPDRVATAHGFRSSFRDWASEHGYARDLAERALAHTVNNQVEAAYHRTDLLEQRRPMMEAWAQHVCSA